ncbi:MAG: flagellar motility protein MotE (MotC chaperone) [Gammaproteobacteria bacterium]|jgi:flagellar motility protein MotE (MotC chaperone)
MTKAPSGRKGTLQVVAGLLLFSAVIRIAGGATDAMALSSTVSEQPEKSSEPVSTDQSPATDILAALRAREARLNERESRMADRMQALRVAEQKMTQQLAALTRAEEALSDTIALADSASELDLARLTTVYENMAAKDAAALFEQMPPQFAAGFLGMMEPIIAAKVMAGLAPETAYSFSVVLAGRNAQVPTQ